MFMFIFVHVALSLSHITSPLYTPPSTSIAYTHSIPKSGTWIEDSKQTMPLFYILLLSFLFSLYLSASPTYSFLYTLLVGCRTIYASIRN